MMCLVHLVACMLSFVSQHLFLKFHLASLFSFGICNANILFQGLCFNFCSEAENIVQHKYDSSPLFCHSPLHRAGIKRTQHCLTTAQIRMCMMLLN